MPTVAIRWPASLPIPQAAPTQSTERRALSPSGGPYDVRALQRDRLAIQNVTFPPFSAAQMAAFWDWYENEIIWGGAWFGSTWPMPQGLVELARRFITPPKCDFIPTPQGNYWRVSADFEVRGRGELPVLVLSNCAEAAEMALQVHNEPIGAFLWRSGTPDAAAIEAYEDDHPPIVNTYHYVTKLAGTGTGFSPFPVDFTISWSDLVDGAVNTLGSNRNGVWPSARPVSVTITDAPNSAVPECRACVFLEYGGWGGDGVFGMRPKGYWSNTDPQACPVTVQGDFLGIPPWYDDGIAGAGAIVGVFLVRAEGGVVTGVWIAP